MRYIRVRWVHPHLDDPVELYSELDDQSLEVRKVELFPDGRAGYASMSESSDLTMLGEKPVPPLAEIAADPQFHPVEISPTEFERVWNAARLVGNPR